MPSNHLILCCPFLLLPSIFPSIRVFSNESVHHIRWPKYWSFSFSISHPNEYSWLISFRMDWLNLLAVQGTLKSLLQHHSSKVSILWLSAFFIVQISHPYNWLIWYLCCPRESQESSPVPQFKRILQCSAFFMIQLSNMYTWLLEKPYFWTFVGKVMSLFFNKLSRFA